MEALVEVEQDVLEVEPVLLEVELVLVEVGLVLVEVELVLVEVELVLVEVEPDRVVDNQVLILGFADPLQHAGLFEIFGPSWLDICACSP